MSFGPAAFLLSFAAAVVGAALIWRGWRGQRVGRHLHCRHCEHDLNGIPSESSRCPECGQIIRYGRPRGRLKRNKRLILTGLYVLLPSLLGLSIIIVITGRKIRWIEHEPLWYVLDCVRSSAATANGEAHLDELERRLTLGKLSAADQNRVIVMLLDYQADPQRAWSVALGRMIERFHRAKQLTATQWHDYLINGMVMSLTCPEVVGTGEPFLGAVSVSGSRYGEWYSSIVVSIDDIRLGTRSLGTAATLAGMTGDPLWLPFAEDADRRPGTYELAVHYTLTLSDTSSVTGSDTFSESFRLTRIVEVADRPPGEPFQIAAPSHLVELKRETLSRATTKPVASKLDPRVNKFRAPNEELVVWFFPNQGLQHLQGNQSPFDVIVHAGKVEYGAGTVSWPTPAGSSSISRTLSGVKMEDGQVDVMLRRIRSDRAQGTQANEASTEFVFRNIRVK